MRGQQISYLNFSKITQTNQARPDEQSSSHMGDSLQVFWGAEKNLWEVLSFSTKSGRKMRKNGIWLNVFPFEKICHSNIKWKPGSVIVPLTWLNLKWPLSNRVCGHSTGSWSCLQCVFAALLMWISSDCCCVEKYQSCSLQGKPVHPATGRGTEILIFQKLLLLLMQSL